MQQWMKGVALRFQWLGSIRQGAAGIVVVWACSVLSDRGCWYQYEWRRDQRAGCYLCPYHTCWSTHQILQPIIFFFCLLVCLHPPSLIPSMHRFTNFTNIAKDLKRKQKNYCIFKNILKTTCLNILFECSLFPVFFPCNTDEIIYSEQGGE